MSYDFTLGDAALTALPSGALQDMNIGSVLGTVGLAKSGAEKAAPEAAREA